MFYETTFLISHDVEQSKVFDVWTEIMQKAKDTGLSVQKDSKPYLRTLSYPVMKQRKAYMATLYVKREEGARTKINDLASDRQEVIRSLTTCINHIPQPRPMTRPTLKSKDASETKRSLLTRDASEKEKTTRGKAMLEEVDKKLQEILDDKIVF